MIRRLWTDESGFVISAELVLVATILVIGMIVGINSLRGQVLQELADTAAAVARVNQTYSFSGITGHSAVSAGSTFADQADYCQGVFGDDLAGVGALCISIAELPRQEGS